MHHQHWLICLSWSLTLAKIAELGTLNKWILKKMDTIIWTHTVFVCSLFVPNWTIDGVYQTVFASQLRDLTVFGLFNSINTLTPNTEGHAGCCSQKTVYQDPRLFVRMPVTAESRENCMEASCTHENVISRAEAKLQSPSWLTAHLANNLNELK